ncbi:hypothetical protein DITRI_Ditri14bG0151100 [Diplodiscus trichospermus]
MVQQLLDITNLWVAHWSKAKWPAIHEGFLNIYRVPNLIGVPVDPRPSRQNAYWLRPANGFLEFNVDGSALGKPGPGILRDNLARWVIIFSKPIGTSNSNEAELLAIKEAMELFANSNWVQSHGLLIESDSKIAVSWVLSPANAP